MRHNAEVLAFDREKRVYKDAYVDNFRRVRHFPSLATIGAGRSDSDSIILVQEAQTPQSTGAGDAGSRSRTDDVPSRLIPLDTLEQMFESTPPLTSFRNAVMCKHTRAREESSARKASSAPSHEIAFGAARYSALTVKPIFKPSSAIEAKTAIQRKVAYDGEDYRERPPVGRSFAPPEERPDWAYNNPIVAKEDVRNRLFFHLPPGGSITADRKYTQEFIKQNLLSRQQATLARRS